MSSQKLLVRPMNIILVLLGCAAAVHATCENARCLRFYNAECRDDSCDNPPCEPSFFWNNRNVTDRCAREVCDTKRCTSTRQCMEEVITANCRAGVNCRQYVRAKCVFIQPPLPRPMDCSDITCYNESVCRLREREGNLHPIVRCIPMERLTSCFNIECGPGLYCREDRGGITCLPNSTTTASIETEAPSTEALTTEEPTEALTTEEPTEALTTEESTEAQTTEESTETSSTEESTEALTTEESTEVLTTEESTAALTTEESTEVLTTEESTEAQTTEESTEAASTEDSATDAEPSQPSEAASCEELKCTQIAPFCQLIFIPSFNVSTASCQTADDLMEFETHVQTNPEPPCSARSCMADEACVDYSGVNLDSGGYCSKMDCDPADNSSCPLDTKCVSVPVGFNRLLGDTHCIPEAVNINFNVSCGPQTASLCEFGTYCADVSMGAIPIGSYCSRVFSGIRTCNEIECPESFLCIEQSYDVQPALTLSMCTDVMTPGPTAPPVDGLVALTCEDLKCPSYLPLCQMLLFPDFNVTVATCTLAETLSVLILTNSTCESLTCEEGQVCIDSYGDDIPTVGYCSSLDCSLSDNTSCPLESKCVAVPSNFAPLSAASACIPEEVDFNFGVSCESENAPECDETETCANTRTGEDMLGSYCTTTPTILLTRRCNDIDCPSETICTEVTFEDVQDVRLSTCLDNNAIQPLLQAVGGCDVIQCGENERCVTELTLSSCKIIPAPPVTPTSEVQTPESPTEVPSQPSEAASCEELKCPQIAPFCQLIFIPSFNVSTASCQTADDLMEFETHVQTNPEPPCSARSCMADEACVDYSGVNLDSGGYCSKMDCDPADNSSCPLDTKCVSVPVGFNRLLGDTHCIPEEVNINFNVSCGPQTASLCEFGTYCADVSMGAIPIGSYCSRVFSGIRTCNEIECPESFLCIEQSYDVQPALTLSMCTDVMTPGPTAPPVDGLVALTCEDLKCPSYLPLCQMLLFPDFNVTVATCTLAESLSVLILVNSTCESLTCEEGQVCIDSYGNDIPTVGYCSSLDCSLSDNTSCPLQSKCVAVPSNFAPLSAASACIPEEVDFNFGVSCESENAPECDETETCANTRTGEDMLGSYCTTTPTILLTRRCNDIDCPSETVCTEITFEDVQDVRISTCLDNNVTQPILQAVGGCDVIQCGENQRCVTDRGSRQSGCIPLDTFAPTCDELNCPESSPCAVLTLPSDPTIDPVALCYLNISSSLDLVKDFNCKGLGRLLCPKSCLSAFQGGRSSGIFCSGCDEFPDACGPGQTCEELSSELAPIIGINATCSNTLTEFGTDCKSRKEPCIGPLYCSEIKLEDTLLGSTTLVGSTCTRVGAHETCEQVNCSETEICTEIQQNGVQLATCMNPSIFNFEF